jgi:hypothetical protein
MIFPQAPSLRQAESTSFPQWRSFACVSGPLAAGLNRPEGRPMSACQIPLPLPRPVQPQLRSVRRPFTPSPAPGPYRLPHDVRDRLGASLAPFRNREAAFTLAVFIARFWSGPSCIERPFSLDRRALKDLPGLDLTEARVRGAIRTLERVGFLDRSEPGRGSRYQATPEGLHRKPVTFRLGLEYRAGFETANKRAAAARNRRFQDRRPLAPETQRRPSQRLPEAPLTKSPKWKTSEADRVYLGELRKAPPPATEPNPGLEAALARLEQGFRQSRGS